jgi:FkbM family methyltransferase
MQATIAVVEEARIQSLTDRLSRLEQEVEQLRKVATFRTHIDLVQFAGSKGFVYTDDLCYTMFPEEHKRLLPDKEPAAAPPARSIDECYASESESLQAMVFCHYWREHLDFTFLDIGCHYGFTAMATARLIQSFGRNNRVIAFDSGIASNLVPFNLALNGMQSRVVFERMAISDRTGPCTVYADIFHSEDNRIVNRMPAKEALSYPVNATTLDDYFQHPGHLILKIDTQGAEPEVFDGMKRLLQERLVTIITEYTPHAIQSRVNPNEWLRGLATDFAVYDAGERAVVLGQKHRLPKVQLEGFAERVNAKPSQYTDLLLIPRRLPGFDVLVQRIEQPDIA